MRVISSSLSIRRIKNRNGVLGGAVDHGSTVQYIPDWIPGRRTFLSVSQKHWGVKAASLRWGDEIWVDVKLRCLGSRFINERKRISNFYISIESPPPLAKVKPPCCCWLVPRVKPVWVCWGASSSISPPVSSSSEKYFSMILYAFI